MQAGGQGFESPHLHRSSLIGHVKIHLFRHSLAHTWLANGGQEGDLMRLAGWRSRTLLSRDGAGAADERVREAHRPAIRAPDAAGPEADITARVG